jgi:hypothetical protein
MTKYGDLKGGNSLGTEPKDANAVGMLDALFLHDLFFTGFHFF